MLRYFFQDKAVYFGAKRHKKIPEQLGLTGNLKIKAYSHASIHLYLSVFNIFLKRREGLKLMCADFTTEALTSAMSSTPVDFTPT